MYFSSRSRSSVTDTFSSSVQAARELRQAFANAGDDTNVGEKLLEDLVAMESAVAMSLIDTEAQTVVLLQRTLTNPALMLEVGKMAKEAVGLSTAIRRRMQGALGAAAGLRAQRRLLKIPRASHGK
jgi:hypothetical protein